MILKPCNLTDIWTVKELLKLSSYTERDEIIKQAINDASEFIQRYTGREFKYKVRTEYYDGKGEQLLLLNHFPIISVTSLYDDPNRGWTPDTLLTEGEDFEILDNDIGLIRSINGKVFADGKSNIKIIYESGYLDYRILPGQNDKLYFDEGTGALTATLTTGSYTPKSLATEIKTQMDSAGSLTYTVSFDDASQSFTISSTSSFSLLFSQCPELAKMLGYNPADASGVSSYTSNYPIVGVVYDIQACCNELTLWRYKYYEKDYVGVTSESRGGQSFSLEFTTLPPMVAFRLTKLRGIRVR